MKPPRTKKNRNKESTKLERYVGKILVLRDSLCVCLGVVGRVGEWGLSAWGGGGDLKQFNNAKPHPYIDNRSVFQLQIYV